MKGNTERGSKACVFELKQIIDEVNNTEWNSTSSLYMFEEKSAGLFPIALKIINLTTDSTFAIQT
jgi:hypothetical protein